MLEGDLEMQIIPVNPICFACKSARREIITHLCFSIYWSLVFIFFFFFFFGGVGGGGGEGNIFPNLPEIHVIILDPKRMLERLPIRLYFCFVKTCTNQIDLKWSVIAVVWICWSIFNIKPVAAKVSLLPKQVSRRFLEFMKTVLST